jgi:hypothetical protein
MCRSEFNKLVTVEELDINGDVVISATSRAATNYECNENPKAAWPAPTPAPAPARLAELPTFSAVPPTKTIKSMSTNGGPLPTPTQAAPAATSVDAVLPPGWKASKDTNSNAYYYNKELNVTQWSHPAPSGDTVASPQPPVPPIVPSRVIAVPPTKTIQSMNTNGGPLPTPTQAAPAATSVVDALPPGWKASKDTNGNAYYYNKELNVTQWWHPADTLPPGWKASKDTNGNAYFYNKELNLTQWRYPALPPGWKASKDTNGNAYYYNKELNVTQWRYPAPSGA